jgi:homoserine kinase
MAAPARPSRVRVAAPATCANLGPGFDAAGLALDWWDTLDVTVRPGPPSFHASGMQAEQLNERPPGARDNLVLASMRALADEAGAALPGVGLELVKGFPLGRGFGSSAAAIALGVLAARALIAPDLPDDTVVRLAARIEGHPDNVAPCLLGGATIALAAGADGAAGAAGADGAAGAAAAPGGDRVVVHRLRPHPALAAVVLVAAAPLSTVAARRALPAQVPFSVAARTAGRAALLAPAITGAFGLLLDATEDVLHQPVRLALDEVAARAVAGLRARGHAAVLSGAGPSVLVLTPAEAAAEALAAAEAVLDGAAGWEARPVALSRTGAIDSVEAWP